MTIRIIKRNSQMAKRTVVAHLPANDTVVSSPASSLLTDALDRLVISLALKAAREDHDNELKLREE